MTAASSCPSWCTNTDCDGNHAGETVAAAKGVSVTPGEDVSLVITPYYDQALGLDPEILLADDGRFSDWAVQLPVEQARRLGRALVDTANAITPSDGPS